MKKNIFKRIGLIALSVCVAIGSFFVPVTKKQYNSANAVSVDSNYLFHANDNYFISVYDFNQNATSSSFILFNGNISYTVQDGVSARVIPYVCSYYNLNINYDVIDDIWLFVKGTDYYIDSGSDEKWFYFNYDTPYRLNLVNSSSSYFCYVFVDNGFNANIYKADLYLSSTNAWETSPRPDGLEFLNIKYYDTNDNTFTFSFLVSDDFYYNSRTYFFIPSSDLSDSQTYNQGYQQGLADNQQNIYDNGYNAGYDVGFGIGRQDGIIEANDYSFISLIGAVIDVPVQTIRNLLNFEFLGINLFDFLMGLVGVLVIIFIVKLVRGG